MINIHEYNPKGSAEYSEHLKKGLQPIRRTKSDWIETEKLTSAHFSSTFKEKEPPRLLDIPGEQAKT